MRAKILFPPSGPSLDNSKRYMSALIILQSKAWVYYSMLVKSDVIWTDRISTAASDGVHVYINQDFFLSLDNDSQRAFLLGHEIAHKILRHNGRGAHFRRRGYHSYCGDVRIGWNHYQYNLAADAVINADLIAHGLEMIPGGVLRSDVGRDDLVDSVYVQLMLELQLQEPEEPQGPEPQSGDDESDDGESDESGDDESDDGESDDGDDDGDNNDDGAGGKQSDTTPTPTPSPGHDEHYEPVYEEGDDPEDASKEDDREVEREVDESLDELEELRERGEQHKAIGAGVGGAGYRHSENFGDGRVDWRQVLADEVTRTGREGDVNYGKIHRRRFMNYGVISPTRKGTLDRIAVIVDTSGSVSRSLLKIFLTELGTLLDTMRPASGCLALWTDSKVLRADEVHSSDELLELDCPGGGGTTLRNALRYMDEQGLDAQVKLVFTDGYIDDADWKAFADANVLVILEREPPLYKLDTIRKHGVRYSICQPD